MDFGAGQDGDIALLEGVFTIVQQVLVLVEHNAELGPCLEVDNFKNAVGQQHGDAQVVEVDVLDRRGIGDDPAVDIGEIGVGFRLALDKKQLRLESPVFAKADLGVRPGEETRLEGRAERSTVDFAQVGAQGAAQAEALGGDPGVDAQNDGQ